MKKRKKKGGEGKGRKGEARGGGRKEKRELSCLEIRPHHFYHILLTKANPRGSKDVRVKGTNSTS